MCFSHMHAYMYLFNCYFFPQNVKVEKHTEKLTSRCIKMHNIILSLNIFTPNRIDNFTFLFEWVQNYHHFQNLILKKVKLLKSI